MKKQSGITIISLAVTIIVLLILAGITVSMVTGDDGIIKNATDSKKQAEISGEKDILNQAIYSSINNNKYGDLDAGELQNELDILTGENKTEVSPNDDETLSVLFIDSQNHYNVEGTKVSLVEMHE